MTYREYYDKLTELEPAYLQFWADVCSIESPTVFKEGVDAVGRYFAEKAAPFGWLLEKNEEKDTGSALCFTMNPEAPGTPVCFSGHMDTVHPVGSFGTPAVRSDGTWLYGPGAGDCKGGAVAGFYAMAALSALGFRDRPLKLILQADEETSSMKCDKRNTRFMIEKARGCAAFLNAEPHNNSLIKEDIQGGLASTVTRKGIERYKFTVTGRANHSSRCDDAVSAVAEAAYKILELEKMKDRDRLTCNCSMLRGGTTPNSVPETCEFTADIRYPDEAALEEARALVRKVTETCYIPGSSCVCERISYRICMVQTPANRRLLEEANRLFAEAGAPLCIPGSSSGGSDAADLTAAGIPTLDSFGVANTGSHSIREKAELASLKEAAYRMGVLAMGLQ